VWFLSESEKPRFFKTQGRYYKNWGGLPGLCLRRIRIKRGQSPRGQGPESQVPIGQITRDVISKYLSK